MWVLRSHNIDGTTYHLFAGQTYTVGRKDVDILIENDASISRKHATLYVKHLEGNLNDPSKLPTLIILDIGSKYGTFRNGDSVNSEETLGDGDNVKFGQFESVFSVHYVPFVITTSRVDSARKKELTRTVHRLGGHLVREWNTCCTHLVMSDIRITIKAVCCLISQKPLVTPEYVSDMVRNISSGLAEPLPNRYLPPLGEDFADKEKVDFDIVPERKNIFRNKKFLFIDKDQLEKMHLVITLGGGSAEYVDPNVQTEVLDLLKTGACFVQPQVQNTNVSICQQKVFDFLQRNNKRLIQESDFGLAVTHCSTEMFCNPDFNVGNSQFGVGRLYSQTLTQQDVSMRDVPGGKRKSDISFPEEKATVNQSTSVQDTSSCSIVGKKRKTRDSSGNTDAVQKSSKQTKLENFVKISSSKQSNQEKVANSISIEGIPVCSFSVKEEPQSVDEMDMDNNSVFVESPIAVQRPSLPVVRLDSSVESSSKHSSRNISRESEEYKPVQSSKISSSQQNGFLSCRSPVSGHDIDVNVDEEEKNLPKNLIQVEFADLVCLKQKKTNGLQSKISLSHGKNFKKFRKVLPLGARLLPQIIGGHELEPYSKQVSRALDDLLNDSTDLQPSHNLDDDDDAGEFDWESQPRQRKR